MARDAAAHSRADMSRAVRTARGAAGASIATLLAAASHAVAGGSVTLLALAATIVLALPICVALAGRVASVWRLSLGVAVSQLIYHWSFAGLGVTASPGGTISAIAPHSQHDAAWSFVPAVAAAGAADWLMWIAHAAAAIVTIALLAFGERAIIGLLSLVQGFLPVLLQPRVSLPRVTRQPAIFCNVTHNLACRFLSSVVSHRGPPRASAPAY